MSDLPPESQWLKELSNGVRTLGTGVILLGAFTPFAVAFADPTTARPFDAISVSWRSPVLGRPGPVFEGLLIGNAMISGPLLWGVLVTSLMGGAIWLYGRWYEWRTRNARRRRNIAINAPTQQRENFVYGNANVDLDVLVSRQLVEAGANRR